MGLRPLRPAPKSPEPHEEQAAARAAPADLVAEAGQAEQVGPVAAEPRVRRAPAAVPEGVGILSPCPARSSHSPWARSGTPSVQPTGSRRDHPAMPDIVAHRRPAAGYPGLRLSATCRTGKAGLKTDWWPVCRRDYRIVQQMRDFTSGARKDGQNPKTE